MTTSPGNGTEQSGGHGCACKSVCGREMEGESMNEQERERDRDGNIGEQSFNGAENKKMGEKAGGAGRENAVCRAKTRRGKICVSLHMSRFVAACIMCVKMRPLEVVRVD